jgi:hypothetical protein
MNFHKRQPNRPMKDFWMAGIVAAVVGFIVMAFMGILGAFFGGIAGFFFGDGSSTIPVWCCANGYRSRKARRGTKSARS